MDPTPLDEGALRRPDFRPGTEITLCDGQAWTFPEATLGDFYFRPGKDGALEVAADHGRGDAFESLLDAFVGAEDALDEMVAQANLAWALLRENYDLAPGDARTLLRMKRQGAPDFDDNVAMWKAIMDVALGNSPKDSPVGSASPSS